MLARCDLRPFVLLCVALLGGECGSPCFAQIHELSDADLAALLKRVNTNMASNGNLAQQYTSDEFWHNRNFDKNGKLTVDESAKYENVYVEGLPYRRKVEENGKPLPSKEAADEEKRYAKAVAERRAMSTKQKWLSFHKTWHSSLPMCCLSMLFENHIIGREQINGRNMLVIESVPRANARPSNNDEKSTLDWKQKSWIDVDDGIFARVEVESLVDKNHMGKGTTIHVDFDRLIDTPSIDGKPERAVWLQKAAISKGRFKLLWMDSSLATEQTWSNYKKFHVDMRLLEDTMEPVEEESGEGKNQR